MDHSLPTAKSARSRDDRQRLRRVVQRRELVGLANDTKWDELISAMRDRVGWKPYFRGKCIDGKPSDWEREWFYHLPFPLVSLQWLDLSFVERIHRGRLLSPAINDHSTWIGELVQQIGFEHQKGNAMFRIFGYSPKSYELFDEEPGGR